ncbi:MAG: sensor histidine kinase [Gaiellaceae bacterium]
MTEAPSWLDAGGKIFHVIPDLATPAQVEDSLRVILGDPTLELFWWDWEGERYVDVHGQPALGGGEGRVVTFVEYESRKVGAIAHDARLTDRPEFRELFVPTIRIAMERDRLHRDLVRKLDELQASRARLVKVADDERRRLERNLHDGAQQRLTVVLLGLRRLEQRLEEEPELAGLAASTRQELEGAIADLRELARGLHPARLAQHGLAAAVRAAVARTSIPIELDLRLERDLPPAVEAAAYYVCAEAVTNTVKHAEASKVALAIMQANGSLTVDVRDDGVGGACIDCEGDATGLGGLKDRVEALGGTLDLDSPAGQGTRLVAVLPIDTP